MKPDQVRRDLADLAAMDENAKRSDAEIRKAAEARLEAVNNRLDDLADEALAGDDEEAHGEYLSLVEERGRLQKVLAE